MGELRVWIKLIVFWLLFFAMQQVWFLLVYFSDYTGTASSWATSFIVALPMAISATMYLLLIPALTLIVGLFINHEQRILRTIHWETMTLVVVCAFLGAADMGLYKVWGTKINAKALGYMSFPREVFPTMFAMQNFLLFLILLAQIVFGWWLLKKLHIQLNPNTQKWYLKTPLALVLLASCIIGIRGGLQKIPINRNWVFQSEQPILNYAALNGFWNTADLLFHPLEKQENPYLFMDPEKAQSFIKCVNNKGEANLTLPILSTSKPNVVILFLESWASDVVGCLGGEGGVTPGFDKLAKQGMLFTQFYASGYRTEQGYLATLSATSALPVGSVIQSFGKFDKLPNLYRTFNELGYQTSFYSGGRLYFDNIEAYLRAAGVKTMKGENDWTIHKRTVWGAYDEETFAMHLNEMRNMPQPFFTSMASMTTHEWFDAQVPQIFSGDADIVNDHYRNTMHYADSCLAAYMKAAQAEPWYQNTLFIIMADHSCMFPKKRNNFDQERHHIPLLLMGGALKESWKGTIIDRIGSQTDIAATLLGQIGQPSADFPYSKDLFRYANPTFAYYAFDNGFGLITDSATVIYDHNRKQTITPTSQNNGQLELLGKALLQVQYQENLDYATSKRVAAKH